MKLLGRSPKRFVAAVLKFPSHVHAAIRCFALFRRPFEVLFCYITRKNPKTGMVNLRDGLVIQLSKDNSDMVTVFLIFCRHDYGIITPGIAVVDIGANIGVFALYAAVMGAKIVHAYEPAEESFCLLKRNIENNDLGKVVFPHRAAVVGKASPPVLFSRRSSVFNAIGINPQNKSDCDLVPTITFAEVVNAVPTFNMFKLDCEGDEYDIILNSEDYIFDRIDELRLECHEGPLRKLIDRFESLGFLNIPFINVSAGNYLCLTRKRV